MTKLNGQANCDLHGVKLTSTLQFQVLFRCCLLCSYFWMWMFLLLFLLWSWTCNWINLSRLPLCLLCLIIITLTHASLFLSLSPLCLLLHFSIFPFSLHVSLTTFTSPLLHWAYLTWIAAAVFIFLPVYFLWKCNHICLHNKQEEKSLYKYWIYGM